MKKLPASLSLKGRALQMLAQREHSQLELRRKLLRHALAEAKAGESPADQEPDSLQEEAAVRVDALLQWLLAHRYLSDARFIESRVHARASRFGNLRIRQELAQHGLTLDADERVRLAQSELDRAQAVWQRKFVHSPQDAAERSRQMRFLAQRGFSADVVRRVLKEAGAPHDNDNGDSAHTGTPGDEFPPD
jgi:regulatory protein